MNPSATSPHSSKRTIWIGELATVLYVMIIAMVSRGAGVPYILFPELGALSHDIFRRPHGTWAKAPVMLIVTPMLTGLIGSIVTRYLPFGPLSALLVIASAMAIIAVLRSPIAPAISAGFLPLSLGIQSPFYTPALLIGLGSLAAIAPIYRRFVPPPPEAGSPSDRIDDIVEQPPADYSWVPYFIAFLAAALLMVWATGLRQILFPPLIVMAFEMFAHADVCPWAKRPLILPLACGLSAAVGVGLALTFGDAPLAVGASIMASIVLLRLFALNVPPALAVGLLPFVMPQVGWSFPLLVAGGTALLTTIFLLWRKMSR